jgi:hypothetical protein
VPSNIVENPKTKVEHNTADAKNVVVTSYHPYRSGIFEHAPAFAKPAFAEIVVFGKGRELVPIVVHAVNLGIVRPVKVIFKLHIVGRIRKNKID